MWGIGEEGWIQLWSGFFGAVAGAVAAAFVALLVVWLTNKKQTSLARDAADQQTKLFEKQLEEQRTGLASQLAHQQESLKKQLDEQRLEARRERERSAMAAIVSGLTVLKAESRNLDFEHRREMSFVTAGIHRWRLELGTDPLGDELQLWPNLIWRAHIFAHNARKKRRPGTEQARTLYVDYLDFLIQSCIQWSRVETDEHAGFINELRGRRLQFVGRKAQVEESDRVTADV